MSLVVQVNGVVDVMLFASITEEPLTLNCRGVTLVELFNPTIPLKLLVPSSRNSAFPIGEVTPIAVVLAVTGIETETALLMVVVDPNVRERWARTNVPIWT
jgi:hypothetical protein